MSTLEEQIDVDAPVLAAWEQLHRVHDYPSFVDGVRSAHPHGRNLAHLGVEVDGVRWEVEAEITDRGRGRVMAWRTLDGPQLQGAFALLPLDRGTPGCRSGWSTTRRRCTRRSAGARLRARRGRRADRAGGPRALPGAGGGPGAGRRPGSGGAGGGRGTGLTTPARPPHTAGATPHRPGKQRISAGQSRW
ncbi:hypothetical protein ACFQ0M_10585 [Kitasatospora aburaviensis]